MLSRFTTLAAVAYMALSGVLAGPASAVAASSAVVTLASPSYTVPQTRGSAELIVQRTGNPGVAAAVHFTTTPGTALAGVNYHGNHGLLNWAAGDTSTRTVVVTLINGAPFAQAKSFHVQLSDPTNASLGSVTSATVTIQGETLATTPDPLEFTASTFAVKQNAGVASIWVQRTGTPSGAVSVTYATSDGTAVAGREYRRTYGVLKWANYDSAAKKFSVAISNAAPFSGTRAFTVTLSGPTGAKIGSPATASVIITGGAASAAHGSLSLSSSGYSVSQSGTSVSVGVARTGGSSGAVSVSYATAGGSAVGGTNFSSISGVLSWADGDSSVKTVSIPILKTPAFSGAKTFSIALSKPAGGATLGSPSSATVSITGATATAGVLSLSSSAYSIGQAGGALTVSVTRTGGSAGAVSVGYATANSTAVAGRDFTSASGVLSWAAGDTAAKSFSVKVSNTTPFSGSRTFAVALASPGGGATVASPASASVTITGSSVVVNPGAMGQAAAARLLMQGTFGATPGTLNATAGLSYATWFSQQASAAPSLSAPSWTSGDWSPLWFKNAVLGPDQLRQRMAFALSEILVISGNGGPLWSHNKALVNYYDLLVKDAFGNYRTLLQDVSLSPAMGQFLAMLRNDKPNPLTGVHADQNYARELMQLFTVGLVKLNLDGSVQKDGSGNPVPTYTQADVENLSNVLTGWSSPATTTTGTPETAWLYDLDEVHPMVPYPPHHDTDAKTIIGGVNVPAGGSAEADLKIALDTLFNHPNAGPFVGKQLIQRLVTSNPSPAYVQRVATVFNNDGSGVRGNLLAVAKAILTDPEATSVGGSTGGKVREPLLRLTNLWRAFSASNAQGAFNEQMIIMQGVHYFGQYPLQSPSVFNFFRPDYEVSGALTKANLDVPEFQITNEATLVTTDNWLANEAYQFITAAGVKLAGTNYQLVNQTTSSSVFLHTAAWEPLAANPTSLVDQMNLVLMAGQMPAAMRTVLINYASAIPASSPGSRVAETAELLISSPQYAVQQ